MKLLQNFTKIGLTALVIFGINLSATSQTCLTAWENKLPITIDNSAGDELTDYQLLITINTAIPIMLGQMNPDGSDIRFTADGCCDQMCYYIEEGINTASTKIWVNVPFIAAGTETVIYAFFGNPDATAASNPECTFAFYTGFDDEFSGMEYLCGSSSDSTLAGGNFNLAWDSNVMLGSSTIFPIDEIYTAEAMMNSTSGNWPGLYWAKDGSQTSYAWLTDGANARISVSGYEGDFCGGHNWASPVVPYGSSAGLWSLTWAGTGNIFGEFPTIGAMSSSDVTFAKDEDLRLLIGGISGGIGSMNIDWVRVRKYAEVVPTYVIGLPVTFEPGPALVMDDEAFGCGEAIIDATAGYDLYEWSTGGTEQLETVDASGMYYVTVTDSEECYQMDSVNVTIGEIYSLTDNDVICSGTDYVFHDGTVISDITETTVHSSNFTTEEFGCDSIIVTTVEVFDFSPVLDLNDDITSCDDTVFIDAGAGFGAYVWSDGSLSQVDTVTTNGTYSVVVIDDNGCEQTDELTVSFTVIDNSTDVDGIEITSNEVGATYQWLDCDNDYAIIAGETAISYTPIEDGSYAVLITKGGCVDTSACITISGVSVPTINQDNLFSIYPNPTTGIISLIFADKVGVVSVKVTNAEGKLLQFIESGDQQLTLNLDGANGLYFVEVISSEGSKIVKVIKE